MEHIQKPNQKRKKQHEKGLMMMNKNAVALNTIGVWKSTKFCITASTNSHAYKYISPTSILV
jgi:hypothetical protein